MGLIANLIANEKAHLKEVRSRQNGSTGDVWFVGEASGASAARLEFVGIARVTEVEETAARILLTGGQNGW